MNVKFNSQLNVIMHTNTRMWMIPSIIIDFVFLMYIKICLLWFFFCIVPELPYTLIAPKIDVKLIEKERLREFLLEHVVPGEALHIFNEEDVYGNCNKRPIAFKYVDKITESQWMLNGLKIMRTSIINERCSVIYVDGVLGDRKATFSKRNIQETNKWVSYSHSRLRNLYSCYFGHVRWCNVWPYLPGIMNHNDWSGKMRPKRSKYNRARSRSTVHWWHFWPAWRAAPRCSSISWPKAICHRYWRVCWAFDWSGQFNHDVLKFHLYLQTVHIPF